MVMEKHKKRYVQLQEAEDEEQQEVPEVGEEQLDEDATPVMIRTTITMMMTTMMMMVEDRLVVVEGDLRGAEVEELVRGA